MHSVRIFSGVPDPPCSASGIDILELISFNLSISILAHSGAVGAGIKPHVLVNVVGTSTVDMMIENYDKLKGKQLKETCGQTENSIIPGFVGIEAGQAAFGDVYAWFREMLMWPIKNFFLHQRFLLKRRK